MTEKCLNLKCSQWNADGDCLRVRLERGDAFPVDPGLYRRDEFAWATEIMRLWRKTGSPALIGGNGPEQVNLAKALIGLYAHAPLERSARSDDTLRGDVRP